MGKVIELARFRVDPGNEGAFLAARPAMERAIRAAYPAIEALYLARLDDDGTWLDVAVWSDPADAERACTEACELGPVAEWMAQIAEDLSMEHGSVVAAA